MNVTILFQRQHDLLLVLHQQATEAHSNSGKVGNGPYVMCLSDIKSVLLNDQSWKDSITCVECKFSVFHSCTYINPKLLNNVFRRRNNVKSVTLFTHKYISLKNIQCQVNMNGWTMKTEGAKVRGGKYKLPAIVSGICIHSHS